MTPERPDPARGVFETLLVRQGVAQHVDAHLARLAASLEALYASPLPPHLGETIAGCAGPHAGATRLRIDVVPAAAGFTTSFATTPTDIRLEEVVLVPVTLPGGLGAHKWVDRSPLDWLRTRWAIAPFHDLLLVDDDGQVLETERASLFLDDGSQLVTPPLDGRILPGTTRSRLMAAEALAGRPVVERPFRLDELRAAHAISVTGALRGRQPARLLG